MSKTQQTAANAAHTATPKASVYIAELARIDSGKTFLQLLLPLNLETQPEQHHDASPEKHR